jgi:choline dehydrogenase-like flavoprotein
VPVAPSARLADDVAPPPEVRPADERRSSRVREELEQAGRTWAAGKEGERRLRVLEALCDTWVPAVRPPRAAGDLGGFWQRRASDLGVHLLMAGWFATHADPEDVEEVLPLFDLLAATGFTRLPAPARAAELKVLAKANAEIDEGLEDLRKLALMLHYAVPDASGSNPAWPIFGYPGPPEVAPLEGEGLTTLDVAPAEAPLVLEADVVVVGSGSGGGVVAGELAQAGLDVVVLEAGGHREEADFPADELSALRDMYWRGGLQLTDDGNVAIVAGATLGGGSTINWQNCVRPPATVRETWARKHGLEGLDGPEFDQHLDAVLDRISGTSDCTDLNPVNARLAAASDALGWAWERAVRNTDPASYDPATAGHVGFGDRTGSKQGTLATYLRDAEAAGARIVVGARADRVRVEAGRAAGVDATWTGPDGTSRPLRIRARDVVVACGALETPALLLRSAIGGPATGKHLRLHPVPMVTGMYDEPLRQWWGPPQGAIVTEHTAAVEDHGYLVETAHFHPAITASAMPWTSGRGHKLVMGRFAQLGAFIAVTREHGGGDVTIDEAGEAVVRYPLEDAIDEQVRAHAVRSLIELHEAAGAQVVLDTHRELKLWRRGRDDLEAFIRSAQGGDGAGGRVLFSAHQMGSARMGTDPTDSVADPDGQLHDTPGVWIGDTSAYPTAVGSNPMLTCMALARRTAHAIVAARS